MFSFVAQAAETDWTVMMVWSGFWKSDMQPNYTLREGENKCSTRRMP